MKHSMPWLITLYLMNYIPWLILFYLLTGGILVWWMWLKYRNIIRDYYFDYAHVLFNELYRDESFLKRHDWITYRQQKPVLSPNGYTELHQRMAIIFGIKCYPIYWFHLIPEMLNIIIWWPLYLVKLITTTSIHNVLRISFNGYSIFDIVHDSSYHKQEL